MFFININSASALSREFAAHNRDYFSPEGYEALIDLFDDGENVELDVVAICCDFHEEDFETIARENRIDLSECDDEDEQIQAVADYLSRQTWAQSTTPGNFIYQAF